MKFKEILKEFNHVDLDEATPVEKDELGSGADHHIYPSKHNPKIVYKLGSEHAVDFWFDMFKNNPKVFPIVYKRGKTKMKLKKDKMVFKDNTFVRLKAGDIIPIDYVEMEKLDPKRAENEWKMLNYAIVDITENQWDFQDYVLHFALFESSNMKPDYVLMTHIFDELKVSYPSEYKMITRFLDLIIEIKKINKHPDLHMYNFGYDTKGVLKCLDI
jgi:hypothetical protein